MKTPRHEELRKTSALEETVSEYLESLRGTALGRTVLCAWMDEEGSPCLRVGYPSNRKSLVPHGEPRGIGESPPIVDGMYTKTLDVNEMFEEVVRKNIPKSTFFRETLVEEKKYSEFTVEQLRGIALQYITPMDKDSLVSLLARMEIISEAVSCEECDIATKSTTKHAEASQVLLVTKDDTLHPSSAEAMLQKELEEERNEAADLLIRRCQRGCNKAMLRVVDVMSSEKDKKTAWDTAPIVESEESSEEEQSELPSRVESPATEVVIPSFQDDNLMSIIVAPNPTYSKRPRKKLEESAPDLSLSNKRSGSYSLFHKKTEDEIAQLEQRKNAEVKKTNFDGGVEGDCLGLPYVPAPKSVLDAERAACESAQEAKSRAVQVDLLAVTMSKRIEQAQKDIKKLAKPLEIDDALLQLVDMFAHDRSGPAEQLNNADREGASLGDFYSSRTKITVSVHAAEMKKSEKEWRAVVKVTGKNSKDNNPKTMLKEKGIDTFSTKKIKPRVNNPSWNESFTSEVLNPESSSIEVQIWLKKSVGSVKGSLGKLSGSSRQWMEVRDGNKALAGKVCISVTCERANAEDELVGKLNQDVIIKAIDAARKVKTTPAMLSFMQYKDEYIRQINEEAIGLQELIMTDFAKVQARLARKQEELLLDLQGRRERIVYHIKEITHRLQMYDTFARECECALHDCLRSDDKPIPVHMKEPFLALNRVVENVRDASRLLLCAQKVQKTSIPTHLLESEVERLKFPPDNGINVELVNWSERLRKCQQEGNWSGLHDLLQDFKYTARIYAQLVIMENPLPDHLRTIRPYHDPIVRPDGRAVQRKFHVNGMWLIFAPMDEETYGSEHLAAKALGHEIRGAIEMHNLDDVKAGMPLMVKMHYLGWTVLATSLLPIDRSDFDSISWGVRSDLGAAADNEEVEGIIQQNMKALNLCPQDIVLADGTVKKVSGPVGMEGHMGSDKNYYLKYFSGMFPADYSAAKNPLYKDWRMVCRLRPELLRKSEVPISPHVFAPYAKGPDSKTHEENAKALSKKLVESCVTQAAQNLDFWSEDHALMYPLRLNLTKMLHAVGINARHFGLVRSKLKSKVWKDVMLAEVCGRVIKADLRSTMRRIGRSLTAVPSERVYIQAIAGYFNKVFGNCAESESFWNEKLVEQINTRYPKTLSSAESGSDVSLKSVLLRERGMQMTMLRVISEFDMECSSSMYELLMAKNGAGLFELEKPLTDDDIVELPIVAMGNFHLLEVSSAHKLSLRDPKALGSDREYAEIKNKIDVWLQADSNNVQHLFLKGWFCEHYGDKAMAQRYYEKTLARDPTYTRALFHLANILREDGHIDRAEITFEKVLELDPEHSEARYGHALILHKRGNLALAEEEYALSVKGMPDFFGALHQYANLLSRQGRYEEADSYYQRALKAPNDRKADLHLNYAHLLVQRNDLERALEQATLAITEDPSLTPCNYILGFILDKLGRKNDAAKYYLAALEAQPFHESAHYFLAIIYDDMGKHDSEAEEHYQSVIEINPNFKDVLLRYGKLLARLGRTEKSANCYKRYLRNHGNDMKATEEYAHAILEIGKWGEAEVYLQRVHENDPTNIKVMMELGGIYEKEAKWDAALLMYNRVLSTDKNFGPVFRRLAYVMWQKKDGEAAEIYYKRAFEHDGSDAESRYSYAHILLERGDKETAIVELQQAFEVAKYVKAANTLKDIYESDGQMENARYWEDQIAIAVGSPKPPAKKAVGKGKGAKAKSPKPPKEPKPSKKSPKPPKSPKPKK